MLRSIHTPQREAYIPPNRYFLTADETARFLGVSKLTLLKWRKSWKNHNPKGPEPVYMSPAIIRYRIDDVMHYPETFLERMQGPAVPKNLLGDEGVAQ